MKDEIRKIAINKRKIVSSREKDRKIIANLRKISEYANAKHVLVYSPLRYEIDVSPVLKDEGKTFYLPRVCGGSLEICKYKPDCLKCGSFGITEPTNECTKDISIIDAVITPGVAADLQGYRLGYGKGYYDRLFASKDFKAYKIMLIYSELILENVFPENNDIKCDYAISENFIYKF